MRALILSLALVLPAGSMIVPASAGAQDAPGLLAPGQVIDFAADTLSYDEEGQLVTATGDVVAVRGGHRLRADEVTWNRRTGEVVARGNVIVTDPSGNQAFGDRAAVTDTLRDGVIENILVVLEDGGRLAARSGVRRGDRNQLNRAVYSPCEVDEGCISAPVWQIKAVRVIFDQRQKRIFYRHAYLEFLGVPIFYVPEFSHPDGSAEKAYGFLVPDIRYDRQLGFSLETPYVLNLSPASDVTLTPMIYTDANPALGVEYRQLMAGGPFRAGAVGTYASRTEFDLSGTSPAGEKDEVRGYLYGNGRFQHTRRLRSTFSARLTTDDTFLRRYDVSRDTVLRNYYSLENFGGDSYFTVQGWAFQGLRLSDDFDRSPIALPLVDFRWRPPLDVLGGRTIFQVNTLAVSRIEGQDMQRGLASLQWEASTFTPLGQRVTATALLRGDVYHQDDTDIADFAIYSGRDGWHARGIPVAAVDVEWPLAGPALGGAQTLTPRVQLVASPDIRNSAFANEDARSIDLEDSNLFSLNRFPGYDRWEGGPRATYGVTWTLTRPRWNVRSEVGQSYRFEGNSDIIPSGTGLTERWSDIVGRTTLRWGRRLALTHRFRADKDNMTLRRNEVDATFGGRRTYATVSYVRLDRDINIEDLRNREEVRLGARVQLLANWSVFGSSIVDLTSRSEDALADTDGFEPIRHRIGVLYDDECFEFGVTWRRDYTEDRDFRRGNTFMVQFALKNLGR